MTMMTCIEVKGQQRSNLLICVIWLPHWSDIPLIQGKDHDDLMNVIQRSSNVRYLIMPYGFHILSEEPLNQTGGNYVLNRGQMLTEVKCRKVCFTIRSLGLKHHQAIKMVTALKRMLPPNLARALAKGTVMSCYFLVLFTNLEMS